MIDVSTPGLERMQKDKSREDLIGLTFGMESGASLWNIIFEGFDQEVVLVSKFVGRDMSAVVTLYKFGSILVRKYKDCKVAVTNSGIIIRKSLPENDLSLISEWTGLMENIREEMIKFIPGSQGSRID